MIATVESAMPISIKWRRRSASGGVLMPGAVAQSQVAVFFRILCFFARLVLALAVLSISLAYSSAFAPPATEAISYMCRFKLSA